MISFYHFFSKKAQSMKKLLLLSFFTFCNMTWCSEWAIIPIDVKREVTFYLDSFADCLSFARTCKEHYEHIPIEVIAQRNLPFLPDSEHTKTLVFFSKKFFPNISLNTKIDLHSEQYKKFADLIAVGSAKNNMTINLVLQRFGYQSSIFRILCAYQAKGTYNSNYYFYLAIIHKNMELLRILLLCEPDVINGLFEENESSLSLAIGKSCSKEMCQLLLQRAKHIINKQDSMGNTALHQTCKNNNYELAQLLIENGCNVNIKNSRHQTPLHIAAKNTEIAKLLISNGADISIVTPRSKKRVLDTLPQATKVLLLAYHENYLKRKQPDSQQDEIKESATKRRRQ